MASEETDHMPEIAQVRPRHLLGHAEFGDEPSGACWCADCDPRPDCACQMCRLAAGGEWPVAESPRYSVSTRPGMTQGENDGQ